MPLRRLLSYHLHFPTSAVSSVFYDERRRRPQPARARISSVSEIGGGVMGSVTERRRREVMGSVMPPTTDDDLYLRKRIADRSVSGHCSDMDRTWLTPAQAAERAKCGRSSIMRALESKNLKAERDNKNRWKISIEALDEWSKNRPDTDRSVTDQWPDTDREETGPIREELAAAKAEIAGLQDRLADTQAERDRLASLLDRALEHRQIGFLGRLFRR